MTTILRALFVGGLMGLASLNALAIAVDQNRLADPALEAEARELFKKYRCVVCDNQSIEDSNAEVAEDLRAIVREQVAAGQSEGEITAYLVARYGDFVLLSPPLKVRTLLLWGLPFALLALGIGLVALRRPKPDESAEAALSTEATEIEAAKLAAWRNRQ